MRGFRQEGCRGRAARALIGPSLVMALLMTVLVSVGVGTEIAEARGPAYNGPQTGAEGPAYFGPAPNPFPYCDSPTYFDPFPENITPIGRMDIGDTASVTTDGVTMDLTINAEGNANTQYPGFFPQGGDGTGTDRAKGIELAEGDGAVVELSAPLFYSQWIFTDVDQPSEGFTVTPTWTMPGEAAVFGGDDNFTFAGSTGTAVQLDETQEDGGVLSQTIEGRVQVDFLGAVDGITMLRTFPSDGQSGFAVGGGCEAAGAAKTAIIDPTWNGTSWDVTYELRIGNNLPSAPTIQSVITDAQNAPGASLVTGPVQGIDLTDIQLTDDLADPAFSSIVVTSKSATGNLVLLDDYNGIDAIELIQSGSVAAESNETITLSVQYTPDLSQPAWDDCANGFTYSNQSEVTGLAANVPVADLSDDGVIPSPANNNGAGGVDDPTLVTFPCPPGDLQIVKTAVPGAGAACPTFANGVAGPGDPVPLTRGDSVTYCISVLNAGPGPVTGIDVTDPQAPQDYFVSSLDAGESETFSYVLEVDLATAGTNTATATGTDATGAVGPETDDARIIVSDRLQPNVQIVKTVVPGGTPCPTFEFGVDGLGPALGVSDGATVTYCISIRNVGAGPAIDVRISDPQGPGVYQIGTLAPGSGTDRQYDVSVTTSTLTRNVATVDYFDADNQPQTANDDAQIDVSPLEPNLEIVKTVLAGAGTPCPTFDDGVAGLGDALAVNDRDTVTYCITVRNIGPGIATDVVVADTQAPNDFQAGTLAANASDTFTYDVTVDLNTELVNTATANGNGPTGALDEESDQAQIAVSALPDPELQIVKTAVRGPGGSCPSFDAGTSGPGNPVRFLEGETVTYCITIRNVGQATATSVVIEDPQAPDTVDLNIGDLAVNDVGVTRSYDVLLDANSEREITNVASVRGQGPNGDVGPVDDPALVEVTQQPDPELQIVKTAVTGGSDNCPATFAEGTGGPGDPVPLRYGDVVTYCITVRNVGGNDANNVVVNDDQASGPIQMGTIAVNQERNASYDITVDAMTPATNVASATGTGPNGDVGPVADTAVIDSSPQPDPVLEIVKTAVTGPTGACPDFDDGTIGAGDPVPFLYGEVVTYCITVRNTGGSTATGVEITDPQAPEVFQVGDLAVNESRTRTYDVTVAATTEPENVATVRGNGPNGQVGPVSDPAEIVPTAHPDPVLEIVKTAIIGPAGVCPDSFDGGIDGPGPALMTGVGDSVTYCLAVRNVGVGDATDVQIADDQAPESPIQIGDLASGLTRFAQYDVVVMSDTNLVNTAVATGNGPNGQVRDDDDSLLELDERIANISLVHSVSKADEDCITESKALNSLVANSQDLPITWCAEITNTGNVPLTNVTFIAPDLGVTEPVDALAARESTVLLPQASVVLGFTGTIPEFGLLSTGATQADASDEDGNLIDLPRPRDIDTAEVREASINLETTVIAGLDSDCAEATEDALVPVGSDITWCFVVTNTGAIDLWVGEVVDVTLGIMVPIPEDRRRLSPNASIVVSVNDVAAEGGMVNDAEVRGQPLDFDGSVLDQAPAVEDQDPAMVNTPVADLSIVKSASASTVLQGEPVTYTLVVTNDGPDAAADVVVRDSLPSGLFYTSVPGADGWACALDQDERGFSCSKATPMDNGESATLSYTVTTSSAPPNVGLENVAAVESTTPDPDPSNNEDDETIQSEPPLGIIREPDDRLEYPGPFPPPVSSEPPDEVLGLAITGAASNLLSLLSAIMLTIGGVLTVGARRSRRE